MNEELKLALQRIRKKIDKSSGYGYLYHHYDNLVAMLEEWKKNEPEDKDIDELTETIEAFTCECNYCRYNSPGWFRYAARSFYCADQLLRFVPDRHRKYLLEYSLSLYFNDLIASDAISFLDENCFQKYVHKVQDEAELKERHQKAIKQTVHTATLHHPVKEDVEYMAFRGSKSAHRLITGYIGKFDDYSHLKEWIPAMETRRLAEIWYEFPDRFIRDRKSVRHMIERIEKYLDDSLDLHLELWDMWFRHDPQEVLEVNEAKTLIEIFEVLEDDTFQELLIELTKIPHNDKVRAILDHFTDDDEDWIVNLSTRLLAAYS